MSAKERPASALVVDASKQIRVLVTTFLSRFGFAVDSAPDIEAALAKLRCVDFDVLLLDPASSDDGNGVSRLAAEFPQVLGRTVVIAAAPHSRVTERVHSILEKPFDLQILLDAAQKCSRSRNLHHP